MKTVTLLDSYGLGLLVYGNFSTSEKEEIFDHLTSEAQKIVINNTPEHCAIEEFFKRHENDPLGTPPCALYCPCPKHRIIC